MPKKNEKKSKRKINLLKPIILTLVGLIIVLGLFYFFSRSSKKSSAEKACNENKKCVLNTQCGNGGYCKKKGSTWIGTCTCPSLKTKKPDCPTLQAYRNPPKGCRYEAEDAGSCKVYLLFCDEGRICETDGICGKGQTCYQPPMPKCANNKACIQVMPQKICKTTNNLLWWFDANTFSCQQKQFTGLYMYKGLQTFKTKSECETALKNH